jgi:O-antigen/teichoic acid export membrane protein
MDVNESTGGKNVLMWRTAWLAAARVVAFALTIPLPLVLVRTLNQSEFGLYKQVFQIMLTVLALSGLSVNMSVLYFLPRNPEKKPQIAFNVLVFYAAVGSLVSLVFAAYPRWVTLIFKGDGLVPYVPLLGVAILLWLLSTVLEVVAVADNDIRSASVFIVIIQLTKSALMMLAAVLFGTVHAIVLAAVLQGALHCLITFVYLHRRFGRFWGTFDWQLFKAQLANAIPFGIGALAYGMQADLHNYFVAHYFDPDRFAIYSVGCLQLPLLGMLFESVVTVLIPEVARREASSDYAGIIELWSAAVRKIALFFIPAHVLLLIVRHEFITTLFTKNYDAAAPIFAVNLLNLFLYISVPTAILRSFDELKYFRLRLSLIMVPIAGAALYGGIRVAGLLGAIAMFITVQTIDLSIVLAAIARRLNMSPKDLRRFAPMLRTVAAALAAGLVTGAVRVAISGLDDFVVLVVCSTVFAAVFLAMAVITGAITATEQAEMRALLHKTYRLRYASSRLSSPSDIQEQQVG